MTGRDYRSVAARIRQELPELDRVARRACRAWASASRDAQDLYIDAVALNIHGFYAGVERIFTLVAERIDGSLPSGPNWHQDLLRQMTAEMPGVRAAVISGCARSSRSSRTHSRRSPQPRTTDVAAAR